MKQQLKEQAHHLPLTPGVYLMKDKLGEIIYVGKAKKLRNRVSSYFIKNSQHSKKTLRMIQQVADFEVILTDTELDALLLECTLIQKNRPLYNRQMNAYEKYKYIAIDYSDDQLAINILDIPVKENCFGPYAIRHSLPSLKQILEETYGLNQANYWHQSFQKEPAPAIPSKIFQKELLDAFNNAGQQPQLRLAEKMQAAANNQAFERAAKLKEDWLFLTRFFQHNQRISQANQNDWQLLWLPVDKKIKYYLIYQGLVIQTRLVTRQTFNKYSALELAEKIMPATLPEKIAYYSKDQVDFLNILYSYINQHAESQLVNLNL